jgi:hypothetical protein
MPLVGDLRQRKLVQRLLACAAVPWLPAARDSPSRPVASRRPPGDYACDQAMILRRLAHDLRLAEVDKEAP